MGRVNSVRANTTTKAYQVGHHTGYLIHLAYERLHALSLQGALVFEP